MCIEVVILLVYLVVVYINYVEKRVDGLNKKKMERRKQMKQIRIGVFETNSSSTHSMTICDKDEYNRWKNGELVYDSRKEVLVEVLSLPDMVIKEIKENGHFAGRIDDKWESYSTYEFYMDNESLEYFEESYTTKNGDNIIAFGRYGYDG